MESRVKRFSRWLQNDQISKELYFLPYVEMFLAQLASATLVLVIDGSVVGRGGVALMVHVVYKGRALPLAWLVRRGKKGHFAQSLHIALIQEVQRFMPDGATVVLLGDGEFDGTTFSRHREADRLVLCLSHRREYDGDVEHTFDVATLGLYLKPGNFMGR